VLQRYEAPVCVDRYADRIEPQLGCVRANTFLLKPRGGHPPQASTLRLAQTVERSAGTHATGLDLAEEGALIIRSDQVDLAPASAVVALDDRKATPLEMLGGELLPDAAEAMTQVV